MVPVGSDAHGHFGGVMAGTVDERRPAPALPWDADGPGPPWGNRARTLRPSGARRQLPVSFSRSAASASSDARVPVASSTDSEE